MPSYHEEKLSDFSDGNWFSHGRIKYMLTDSFGLARLSSK